MHTLNLVPMGGIQGTTVLVWKLFIFVHVPVQYVIISQCTAPSVCSGSLRHNAIAVCYRADIAY